MGMSDKAAGAESGRHALAMLGRRCCDRAVDLYRVRRSALRTLGRACTLVRSLRHVPPEDLRTMEGLLVSLADFHRASFPGGAPDAGDESTLSGAVATTFSAAARRRLRACSGLWTPTRAGAARLRLGPARGRAAGVPSITAAEFRSLLEDVTALAEETRRAEKDLDLAGFGLMPCDCARFGLREQMRCHILLCGMVRLGGLLTRRLG